MIAVFDYLLTVQASDIDELGHASNTVQVPREIAGAFVVVDRSL